MNTDTPIADLLEERSFSGGIFYTERPVSGHLVLENVTVSYPDQISHPIRVESGRVVDCSFQYVEQISVLPGDSQVRVWGAREYAIRMIELMIDRGVL
jgi:hypothetical protein